MKIKEGTEVICIENPNGYQHCNDIQNGYGGYGWRLGKRFILADTVYTELRDTIVYEKGNMFLGGIWIDYIRPYHSIPDEFFVI